MAVKPREDNGALAEETTPLLQSTDATPTRRGIPVIYRILLCAFMVSLTFGVTQVPMLYVFRKMACEAYYEERDSPGTSVERCAKREIEARTAREIALLGVSTTVFGLANLLITRWCIKRFGIKRALLVQIFSAAARLAIQNVGATTGSNVGIAIMQASQIITIFGGPNGYVLALNSFVTEIVKPEERTGSLGRLQGCMMVGIAVGFLVGGVVGTAFGIIAPFRITLALFLLDGFYVAVFLPSIATENTPSDTEKPAGLLRFFGPLHVFAPQKWTLPNGRTSTQFGALTLGVGVFLAILATGYIPTLLQLYSTDTFGFGTSENGWLIFMYSSLRGLYLSLVFPRIISAGRKWLEPDSDDHVATEDQPQTDAQVEDGRPSPNDINITDQMDNETEPLCPPERKSKKETFAFDLFYARCSLLTDAILTSLAIFVSKGWQLYVVAALLPLAAGTGASSKGSILQMLPNEDRTDALSGITLVENIARLSTVAVFGLIYAALAEQGQTHFFFICNGGVALLGSLVLLLSRFPPKGSTRLRASDI